MSSDNENHGDKVRASGTPQFPDDDALNRDLDRAVKEDDDDESLTAVGGDAAVHDSDAQSTPSPVPPVAAVVDRKPSVGELIRDGSVDALEQHLKRCASSENEAKDWIVAAISAKKASQLKIIVNSYNSTHSDSVLIASDTSVLRHFIDTIQKEENMDNSEIWNQLWDVFRAELMRDDRNVVCELKRNVLSYLIIAVLCGIEHTYRNQQFIDLIMAWIESILSISHSDNSNDALFRSADDILRPIMDALLDDMKPKKQKQALLQLATLLKDSAIIDTLSLFHLDVEKGWIYYFKVCNMIDFSDALLPLIFGKNPRRTLEYLKQYQSHHNDRNCLLANAVITGYPSVTNYLLKQLLQHSIDSKEKIDYIFGSRHGNNVWQQLLCSQSMAPTSDKAKEQLCYALFAIAYMTDLDIFAMADRDKDQWFRDLTGGIVACHRAGFTSVDAGQWLRFIFKLQLIQEKKPLFDNLNLDTVYKTMENRLDELESTLDKTLIVGLDEKTPISMSEFCEKLFASVLERVEHRSIDTMLKIILRVLVTVMNRSENNRLPIQSILDNITSDHSGIADGAMQNLALSHRLLCDVTRSVPNLVDNRSDQARMHAIVLSDTQPIRAHLVNIKAPSVLSAQFTLDVIAINIAYRYGYEFDSDRTCCVWSSLQRHWYPVGSDDRLSRYGKDDNTIALISPTNTDVFAKDSTFSHPYQWLLKMQSKSLKNLPQDSSIYYWSDKQSRFCSALLKERYENPDKKKGDILKVQDDSMEHYYDRNEIELQIPQKIRLNRDECMVPKRLWKWLPDDYMRIDDQKSQESSVAEFSDFCSFDIFVYNDIQCSPHQLSASASSSSPLAMNILGCDVDMKPLFGHHCTFTNLQSLNHTWNKSDPTTVSNFGTMFAFAVDNSVILSDEWQNNCACWMGIESHRSSDLKSNISSDKAHITVLQSSIDKDWYLYLFSAEQINALANETETTAIFETVLNPSLSEKAQKKSVWGFICNTQHTKHIRPIFAGFIPDRHCILSKSTVFLQNQDSSEESSPKKRNSKEERNEKLRRARAKQQSKADQQMQPSTVDSDKSHKPKNIELIDINSFVLPSLMSDDCSHTIITAFPKHDLSAKKPKELLGSCKISNDGYANIANLSTVLKTYLDELSKRTNEANKKQDYQTVALYKRFSQLWDNAKSSIFSDDYHRKPPIEFRYFKLGSRRYATVAIMEALENFEIAAFAKKVRPFDANAKHDAAASPALPMESMRDVVAAEENDIKAEMDEKQESENELDMDTFPMEIVNNCRSWELFEDFVLPPSEPTLESDQTTPKLQEWAVKEAIRLQGARKKPQHRGESQPQPQPHPAPSQAVHHRPHPAPAPAHSHAPLHPQEFSNADGKAGDSPSVDSRSVRSHSRSHSGRGDQSSQISREDKRDKQIHDLQQRFDDSIETIRREYDAKMDKHAKGFTQKMEDLNSQYGTDLSRIKTEMDDSIKRERDHFSNQIRDLKRRY